MIDPPKTKAEAAEYRYNQWAGNPAGSQHIETRCAYEIFWTFHSYQCSLKPGHGPDGLYCKQHARIVERKG